MDNTNVIASLVEELEAPQRTRGGENAFQSERARLRTSPAPAGVLPPGSAFPDAVLLDPSGGETSLGAVTAGRPAVVVFYRGAWCPYCNIALRVYQDALVAPLADRGIALVAISPQKPDGSMTMAEKHSLSYAVLSDAGNTIAAELGILTRPADDALELQRENGLHLAEVNADGTVALPMPTVALVDAGGVLRWIDVHPDYSSRTEPFEILDAVDALRLGEEADRG